MSVSSKNVSTHGTVEERLNYFSTEALPQSIKNISENSKNLTPVIEYLEQAYLTAADQETQIEIETQAKTYLTDALTTVVDDINAIARNLEQFVGLQVEAVDSLGTQLDLIKTKMALYKEQHGSQKLHHYRDAVRTTSGAYSRNITEESLSKGDTSGGLSSVLLPSALLARDFSAPEAGSSEEKQRDKASDEKIRSTRVSLQSRLSRLDDVGVCLDREESKQANKGPPARRSSLNKQPVHTHRPSISESSSYGGSQDTGGGRDDDDDMSVSSQSSSSLKPPPRLSVYKS